MSTINQQTWTYQAIIARQSAKHSCLLVAAPARDILSWAQIERVGRSGDGSLRGFQRPQIASHIKEIRDYLAHADAVLPNPIVVAFVGGVKIVNSEDGAASISITPSRSGLG